MSHCITSEEKFDRTFDHLKQLIQLLNIKEAFVYPPAFLNCVSSLEKEARRPEVGSEFYTKKTTVIVTIKMWHILISE